MTPSRSAARRFSAFRWIRLGLAASCLGLGAASADEITSHGFAIFGALDYPADFPHLAYVNPDAPKGGEISLSTFGGFDSMNPYAGKGRAGALSTIFYESLLEPTADKIGSYYCLLCESLTYPQDRSEVTFTLREGIRFSDGTPLTAEDVVFSAELLRDKGLQSYRVQMQKKLQSVEALDGRTVRFTFKPEAASRDTIADVGGLPVFSKAHYQANDRDLEETGLEPFLGSGPYVLDRMEVGQTLVYKRSPNHWGADLPLNRGRYNFDRIRIEYYGDSIAAFEGFKGGAYTFRNENNSKAWATGYDFPAVTRGHVVQAELPNGNKATGQAWIFNLRRATFQDPLVREAIGLMFNYEWSNERLFYGSYDRVNSFWDNSPLAAEGVPSAAERAILAPLVEEGLLPPAILTDEALVQFLSSDRNPLDRKAKRRATKLLEQAGWEVNGQGKWEKDGQLLRVEILNDAQAFNRIIDPFVRNLNDLGITAVHTRIDNAQMTERESPPQYDFDMVTAFMATSMLPGTELRQYYGSETADDSQFNKMGLRSEAVDRLIDVVLAAETEAELEPAVKALDRVLRAERFWVPQWNKNTHTVAYYDMYEHPENLPPYALGEIDFWWWNAEKAARLEAEGAL